MALQNYHHKFGTFPPAYTVDSEVKPLHSWRVLILPMIEQKTLYDDIRLEEPWDSEYNRQFHTRMPSYYICPKAAIAAKNSGQTSYKWIIGPNTVSNGPSARPLSDFTRGTSNSIVAIEVVPSTNWMNPSDVPVADIAKEFGSPHKNGITVAFADCAIKFIADVNEIQENADICE